LRTHGASGRTQAEGIGRIDDDFIHAAHASPRKVTRELDDIAHMQTRVAKAFQHKASDHRVALHATIEPCAKAPLCTELRECCGRRHELLIRCGVEREVSVKSEDRRTRRSIDDRDRDVFAKACIGDELTQLCAQRARRLRLGGREDAE
jgi:hypothetical protein